MGKFTTGIAIVTTLDAHQKPFGLTINAFSSLSLDPPMVLFCL
ncbi:MAG: flavin reductase family protein, partial [Alphaproteobacteria bacterium]|nr:flavin reductase family protein [Alphaproteobacteria bacterium]